MRGLLAFLALLSLALVAAISVRAEVLVADLSDHEIHITTGFAGTELLLFGVADGPGEVIVIVSGPDRRTVVRRKDRISGLWINNESVEFGTVPGFYRVAATNSLSNAELEQLLAENGVGFRYLNLSPTESASPVQAIAFREALLRRKEVLGLYSHVTGRIDMIGGRLFRTRMDFPANVPTGEYRVDVYRVDDGWVQSTTTIPLRVAKVGIEQALFRFAREHPALYGLFAIWITAMAGYGAGMLFRRR